MTEILRPEPADEGPHTPGTEDLWSESWYFDGVSDDGTLGVYTRLGRLPNQDVAIITAHVPPELKSRFAAFEAVSAHV